VCEREIGGGFGGRWQRGCHVVERMKVKQWWCREVREMKGREAKS